MKSDIRQKRLLKWKTLQDDLNIDSVLPTHLKHFIPSVGSNSNSCFPWKQSDSSIVGFSNKQVHYEKRKRWYRYNFRQSPRFLGPKNLQFLNGTLLYLGFWQNCTLFSFVVNFSCLVGRLSQIEEFILEELQSCTPWSWTWATK